MIILFFKENRQYSQNDCFFLICSSLFALEESNCGCNSTLDDFSKNCLRQFYSDETNIKICILEYLKDFRCVTVTQFDYLEETNEKNCVSEFLKDYFRKKHQFEKCLIIL